MPFTFSEFESDEVVPVVVNVVVVLSFAGPAAVAASWETRILEIASLRQLFALWTGVMPE